MDFLSINAKIEELYQAVYIQQEPRNFFLQVFLFIHQTASQNDDVLQNKYCMVEEI